MKKSNADSLGVANSRKETFWVALSLFGSMSTLLCCALPALLVTLGLGAVVAGLVTQIPGLIWISENKVLVFAVAGFLLLVTGILRRRAAYLSCPVNILQAQACMRMKSVASKMYRISIMFYIIGFFFAFLFRYFI